MVNFIPMTVQGSKKLYEELQQLKRIKRPLIIHAISEARKHGDLKENAEYHAAREEQSFCEGRIKEIELKLSNCQIIDVTKFPNNGKVIFGSTVTILNIKNNEKFIYKIVGDDEADFKKKLISINSPMARSLIGKKTNMITKVSAPGGDLKYRILKIDYV